MRSTPYHHYALYEPDAAPDLTETGEHNSAIMGIDADLHAEETERKAADAELDTKLADETKARTDADTELTANIAAETSARTAADTALDAAYKAADTALGGRIDNAETEIAGIKQLGQQLAGELNSESRERTESDTYLQALISSISDDISRCVTPNMMWIDIEQP